MLDRRFWGFALLGLLAGGVAPTACGGDEITKVVTVGPEAGTGQPGESCNGPTDCSGDLLCLQGVCVTSADELGLGAQGESCASNHDCAEGLSCVANVCTDPESAASQEGPGKRGESCQTRSDCEEGLTCINGTCTIEEFGLEPTGKMCVSSACGVVEDCADHPSCASWQSLCALDAVTYASSCASYDIYCDSANWECSAGACSYTATCATNADCPNQLRCDPDSTQCVECHAADTFLCTVSEECVDNACQTSCLDNADCPLFHECDTENNTCNRVGCATDRECVAYTSNALAECDGGECVVPCQTDSECANPFAYNFKACVEGFCVSVGCETDEECRIYNGSFGNWACVEP